MMSFKTLAAMACCASAAFAQSAAGNWQYVNGSKITYIKTVEEAGQLKATITKVTIDGKEDPNAMCAKCDDKGKPLAGLLILWDTKRDGAMNWKDGKLLDPDSGRVVNGKVEVVDGGNKLNVKGSVAFLSKTQAWTKVK